MSFAKNLKKIRNYRDVTQEQLAIMAGLPKSGRVMIAQYEMGEKKPRAEMIACLSKALNVGLDQLRLPNVDSYYELIQTLFSLEDEYNLQPVFSDDGSSFTMRFDANSKIMNQFFEQWKSLRRDYEDGLIDDCEYKYSKIDLNNGRGGITETYKVEITETLQRQIEVKAKSKEEAERIVRGKYRSEEIVLSSEDHIETIISAINKNKCRKHEER